MQHKRTRMLILLPATACTCGALLVMGCLQSREPGGTAQSAYEARDTPSSYAWGVFFYLNRQAQVGVAGRPDPLHANARSYDDDRDVVWETFARVNPTATKESEVFPQRGEPACWEDLDRPERRKATSPLATGCSASDLGFIFPNVKGSFDFIPQGTEEVRLNRAAYDYVRDKHLYCQDTLRMLFAQVTPQTGSRLIDFPDSSKVIKAIWEPRYERDKKRYHWRIGIDDKEYVLVAMHIVTKDSGNWVWTTFIHVDHESKSPGQSLPTPIVDASGSKWEYYRLLGTQTEFTDSQGMITRLANPKIELRPSSCISCHANAVVNVEGIGIEQPMSSCPPFGTPDLSKFWDFEWDECKVPVRLLNPRNLPTDFIFAAACRPRPGTCGRVVSP